MADREFIENIWVVVRQVDDYESGANYVLYYLLRNDARLVYPVSANHGQLEGLESRFEKGPQK